MWYVVRFRQSMCDLWVERLHTGGQPMRFRSLDAARMEAESIATIYGPINVAIVDSCGMRAKL